MCMDWLDAALQGGKDIPEQLLQLMNDAKADAGVQVDIRQLSNAMVKERDIILARWACARDWGYCVKGLSQLRLQYLNTGTIAPLASNRSGKEGIQP